MQHKPRSGGKNTAVGEADRRNPRIKPTHKQNREAVTRTPATAPRFSPINVIFPGVAPPAVFSPRLRRSIIYQKAITGGTSLLADNSQTQLKEGVLYVKPDLADVKIVLDGKLKSGTQASFRAAAPIKPSQTANDPIGKQNQYNVSFSLDQSKGQLVLSITVDSTLTPVEIVIPIIPE